MKKILTGILTICVCGVCFGGAVLISQKEINGTEETAAKNDLDEVLEIEEKETNDNNYAISTANEIATMVGADVMNKGGNAVDAAIASAYVLGVVEPYGSGIGGSGGMLVYDPDSDEYTFFNYYAEAAPSGMQRNSIGIPGFVSGMEATHEKYGSLPMDELLEYAIDLAENGCTVTSELASRISNYESYLKDIDAFKNVKEGDTLIQTELAEALKKIAENGASEFYEGTLANDIISKTNFTTDDLKQYATKTATPVISHVAGYEIASAPAPFSGLTVIQCLKLIELSDLPDPQEDPQTFIDGFTNIRMTVGYDRYNHLYDTSVDGSVIDYDSMLTSEYLQNLIGISDISYDTESESTDTTHVSIVDQNGMTVSMTNTLSNFWGSKIYVDGFFLNNSLNNFGSGVNDYEAGKRPRTFTAPTILRKSEGETIAVGSPGGNVIPDVVTEVMSDILFYGTDPQEAVEKQRVVVRSYDSLMVEENLDTPSFLNTDDISGYDLIRNDSNRKFGSVNIAGYDGKQYYATSDPHRKGYGYAENTE